MEIFSSNLGYPRIGEHRELKKALESYWQGKTTDKDLWQTVSSLQQNAWQTQKEAEIDFIPVGDFSLYDHMLDMAIMFGFIPKRFRQMDYQNDLDLYFALARGTNGIFPLEMTKWFDTNYHYLVPEIDTQLAFVKDDFLLLVKRAKSFGINPKAVLIGPYTFLKLSKVSKGQDIFLILEKLVTLYKIVLKQLAEIGIKWIQIDEPALVLDITSEEMTIVKDIYETLMTNEINIILQTYFEGVSFYEEVISLPVQGIGLDFIHSNDNLENIKKYGFPSNKVLGLGIINGRGVWRTNLERAFQLAQEIIGFAKPKAVFIQPSCSLLHLPINIELETQLTPEVKNLLAFAKQRLQEVADLTIYLQKAIAPKSFYKENPEVHSLVEVKKEVVNLREKDLKRALPYSERCKRQKEVLNLPLFPTTTIGSFPQTQEVREMRTNVNRGDISIDRYEQFVREKIAYCIGVQEGLGLDVLVHGEFERSDMVEYFAQKMKGFIVTKHGWVQSYGSRAARPPIIYADIDRTEPMTLKEITYAQSITKKPVKAILTGPVTMLNWSFVREDMPKKEAAFQIALALRAEVLDLEKAGIKIIQIDEPAFREGVPLKKEKRSVYLDWAAKAFRLTNAFVKPQTQIHTHMCYAEFKDIIETINKMDADVISIECSRSKGDIITVFEEYHYQKGIGLGVYDIHSPLIPKKDDILAILKRCLKVLKADQVWVNPDCGLKTRRWVEVIASLEHMVAAARRLREEIKNI